MKQQGVLLSVLFALGITLVSVSYIFYQFYVLNKSQYYNQIFQKSSLINQVYIDHIQNRRSSGVLEANLAVYDIDIILNINKAEKVLNNAHIIKSQGPNVMKVFTAPNAYSGFLKRTNLNNFRISMLEYSDKIYFFLQSPLMSTLLLDQRLKPYIAYNLLYSYLIIISVIILSFAFILQRIRPLRKLRKKIELFGSGNMDISFKLDGDDEIAHVANELENTKNKINALIESRNLFLRNIMHELKTPIAKGRILSMMVDNPKYQERFINIFTKLESLIAEFALIEQMSSGNELLDINEYRLIDLIDGAIDLAMIERENIDIEVDSTYKLNVDFKLFVTAIKNMIDNAMKYSPDKKITILVNGSEMYFESRGEKLKKPISYYVEPFTQDNPSKDSFGLGLYLVDVILNSHKMLLSYEYLDGVNRFIFEKK